jgi:hypothetical protein
MGVQITIPTRWDVSNYTPVYYLCQPKKLEFVNMILCLQLDKNPDDNSSRYTVNNILKVAPENHEVLQKRAGYSPFFKMIIKKSKPTFFNYLSLYHKYLDFYNMALPSANVVSWL